MENIQATLPPSVIKRVVKRRGFNTTIIGAYVHDDKLFVMYNGLSEFIFTSEEFPPIVWESITNNGLRTLWSFQTIILTLVKAML